ncbi:hypothetical protein G7Y89_g10622 [Cudoniella acicularis]|uniref:Uncharacterized protein n=1 Tax=Cudoniella acicularis TaxID=354080 RepID=A0A8H4RDH4_9HELO|nr:hypothetical protein G7Y89_g10622 [Cudoniella acicularis]
MDSGLSSNWPGGANTVYDGVVDYSQSVAHNYMTQTPLPSIEEPQDIKIQPRQSEQPTFPNLRSDTAFDTSALHLNFNGGKDLDDRELGLALDEYEKDTVSAGKKVDQVKLDPFLVGPFFANI